MLGKAIGIDFGTSSIKFYKNGEGIILHEKSVIAIKKKTNFFILSLSERRGGEFRVFF